MLTVSEARARVMTALADRGSLPAERIDVLTALGRVLAEPVVAGEDLPGFDDSAMDGYAGRATDLVAGAVLPVVAEVPAGACPQPLPPGAVARIFTGAVLPAGADTVLIQEHTARWSPGPSAGAEAPAHGAPIVVSQTPAAGANVRRRGSDVVAGALVLPPGRVLSPGDVGLLAALGRTRVVVVRRPVVAILGSGDELVPVDAGALPPGRRRDSNAWQLAAAVIEAGGLPQVLPTVPDTAAATRRAVAAAASRADVLLTSGGVSVGDHDHLAAALRDLAGAAMGFHKVALRPGKPLAFGTAGPLLVFGLPGNPVSAGVTFELFVRPVLLGLAGHPRCFRRATTARLVHGLPAGDGREAWLRGALTERSDGLWVDVSRTQSSGALSSLAGADALVRVAVAAPPRPAGGWVSIHRLDVDDRVSEFDPGPELGVGPLAP